MIKYILMAALTLSGCVSINTYERQMKKCREASAETAQLRTQVAALEGKNVELKKDLVDKEDEKAVLKSEISNVRSTYDELVQELKDSIAKGEVGIQETQKGLMITLGNQILFRSGKARLQPQGEKVLVKIADIIRKVEDKLIQVEGHTDNVPIANALKAQFPSNWELSAARSASVVRFLQNDGKIDPSRLVLTAFSEQRPVEDNSTAQGRQHNRRVEIILIPRS